VAENAKKQRLQPLEGMTAERVFEVLEVDDLAGAQQKMKGATPGWLRGMYMTVRCSWVDFV
jgi:hypothetical protein